MARSTNLTERGEKTQRLLSEVLMQLIAEKGYDKITVKDITSQAGIDRTTFYLHFKDKDELFSKSQNRLVEELLSIRQTSQQPYPLATFIFEHMSRHADAYLALFESGENIFTLNQQNFSKNFFKPLLDEILTENKLKNELETGLLMGYFSGALRGMALWWLRAGRPYSPAEMGRRYVEITVKGMASLWHPENSPNP